LIDLLTAEEARMKVRSTQKDRFENEMLIIAKIINESITDGQMSCTLNASISRDAEEELTSRGYIVKYRVWGNTHTIISWGYQ